MIASTLNDSNSDSAIETHQITHFVDDVAPVSYEKPSMSSVEGWSRIAEDSKVHDIVSILGRPTIVYTGEFNNLFTSATINFPDAIFLSSLNVRKKLDFFTYFRANVKVKIVLNCTPFISGKYWVFFAPFDTISNRAATLTNLSGCTGYPGVEIDLAASAPIEIKIPYCSPLSHYNLLDTHSTMGSLYIVPITAAASGTSPLTVGVPFTVFAWFEDVELAAPTSLPMKVPPLRAQVGKVEEVVATAGPTISGIAGTIASLAASVGGAIPKLSPWVRPVEWVSRAVGGAASTFGWNKPTSLDKVVLVSNVPGRGYTHADGIDMSVKLAAMPDNGLTYDAGIFSTDVDEMDIAYVCSKSCIVRNATPWDASMLPGTQLLGLPVTPGLCIADTNIPPTTLAFVSSMFTYWRGGLKYRLAVAKTAFHTGRLRISFSPGVHTTTVGSVYENCYNWVLDLSVSSEIEFEIPYIANVPWKEVLLGTYTQTGYSKETYSTGLLVVEVLTPLRVASTNVTSTLNLTTWISGGDDIAFAIPTFGGYSLAPPALAGPVSSGRKLEGFVDDDEQGDEELHAQIFNMTSPAISHSEQTTNDAESFLPKSRLGPTMAEQLSIGERITSLRQLIKRFGVVSQGYRYPYYNLSSEFWCFPGPIPLANDNYLFNQITIDPGHFGSKTAAPEVDQIVNLPLSVSNDGTVNEAQFLALTNYPARSPLSYISYLYRFYRGGRRYKMVTPSTNGVNWASTLTRPAGNGEAPFESANAAQSSLGIQMERPSEPLYARRRPRPKENGSILPPELTSFTKYAIEPLFETYNYSDINGTLEFEVPYYAQTPISIVAEGTLADTEGPLLRRSYVDVSRSLQPRGLDMPTYEVSKDLAYPCSTGVSMEGIRKCFGGYTLYEAAADDFSFGYLIGAPVLVRNFVPT
jgi:hypothetical protein